MIRHPRSQVTRRACIAPGDLHLTSFEASIANIVTNSVILMLPCGFMQANGSVFTRPSIGRRAARHTMTPAATPHPSRTPEPAARLTTDEHTRSVPNVLIAIPTFCRVDGLPDLIRLLRTHAAAADVRSRLLLVDNDPERSAESTATELGVDYLPVPTPGIAAARQAALDAAAPDELVGMIDDDLVPERDWLSGLLDAWEAHEPAVVMGFVRYVWPVGTDSWIAAGGFMRRTRFPTGTELSALSTGNVLFDIAQLRALGVRFDIDLGLSGGSDLEFGRVLLAAGGRIVASAESVARDDIVAERTTLAFVHRRAICQGQVRARLMSRDPRPSAHLAKRAGHFVGGVVRVPVFAAAETLALLRHDVRGSAVYRRRRWFAQGRVLGAIGRFSHEYARTPRGS